MQSFSVSVVKIYLAGVRERVQGYVTLRNAAAPKNNVTLRFDAIGLWSCEIYWLQDLQDTVSWRDLVGVYYLLRTVIVYCKREGYLKMSTGQCVEEAAFIRWNKDKSRAIFVRQRSCSHSCPLTRFLIDTAQELRCAIEGSIILACKYNLQASSTVSVGTMYYSIYYLQQLAHCPSNPYNASEHAV